MIGEFCGNWETFTDSCGAVAKSACPATVGCAMSAYGTASGQATEEAAIDAAVANCEAETDLWARTTGSTELIGTCSVATGGNGEPAVVCIGAADAGAGAVGEADAGAVGEADAGAVGEADAGAVGEADAGAAAFASFAGPRGALAVGWDTRGSPRRAVWMFGFGESNGAAVVEAMIGCDLVADRDSCGVHGDGSFGVEDPARRCVAIAVTGSRNQFGYFYGSTRGAAVANAISECERKSGSGDCRITRSHRGEPGVVCLD